MHRACRPTRTCRLRQGRQCDLPALTVCMFGLLYIIGLKRDVKPVPHYCVCPAQLIVSMYTGKVGVCCSSLKSDRPLGNATSNGEGACCLLAVHDSPISRPLCWTPDRAQDKLTPNNKDTSYACGTTCNTEKPVFASHSCRLVGAVLQRLGAVLSNARSLRRARLQASCPRAWLLRRSTAS